MEPLPPPLGPLSLLHKLKPLLLSLVLAFSSHPTEEEEEEGRPTFSLLQQAEEEVFSPLLPAVPRVVAMQGTVTAPFLFLRDCLGREGGSVGWEVGYTYRRVAGCKVKLEQTEQTPPPTTRPTYLPTYLALPHKNVFIVRRSDVKMCGEGGMMLRVCRLIRQKYVVCVCLPQILIVWAHFVRGRT